MEANKVKETFDILFQLIDNKVCFECNQLVDQWVSVTNGIFLCDSCVPQHKILNENVSVTKHITDDSWTEEELAMMRFGGNAKLKAFFEDYSIERVGGSLGFKYCTKAGYYYRRQLKALAQKRMFAEVLNEDEAMKLEVPNSTRREEDYSNDQDEGEGKDSFEKFDAYVEEKFDNFVDKTHKTIEQVTEKLADPEFREGVKQDAQRIGNSIVTGTVDFANKVNNALTDPEFQQNVKEVGGMIADGAKKGFMSAFGFFQKLLTDEPSPKFEEEKYDTVYKQEDYGFGPDRSNDRVQIHEPTDYPIVKLKPDSVVRSNKQYEVDTLDM